MQNNFSSADNHELSFAYAYQWSEPVHDVELAIKILTCPSIGCESEEDPCAQAESEINRIRCALASHPSTPPTVLAHLVNCGVPFILVRIAENPHTDENTLRRLAQSYNTNVREAVAENAGAPNDILNDLSTDECADVRFAIAENPNVPWDILENLTRDENPYVAYRAQTTINRLDATTQRGQARQFEYEFRQQVQKRRRASS